MFNPAGYEKDFNLPGDTQGEYNGAYAAVTTNNTYDPSDPSSGVDIVALLKGIAADAPSIVRGAVNTIRDARTAATAASTPTLTEQWLKASLIEKVGLGILVFLALRLVVHDFR